MNSPWGIALDSSNTLYIADSDNSVIRVIDGITLIINTVAGE